MLAESAGRELGKLAWCGVPFCGGCPELRHIRTRSGLASDLHRHLINLARVVRDADLKQELIDRLDRMLFHPDELRGAQWRCIGREEAVFGNLFTEPIEVTLDGDVGWAADYFACAWMGRGGHAGKQSEFTQGLAVRYTSSGGDSARRFRSAVESLDAWSAALQLWQFELSDAFDFLDRVHDQPGHGLYIDAPWPELGDEYRHSFPEHRHTALRDRLAAFKHVRIVIRYGGHPLIRELYAGKQWRWVEQETRNQQNNEVSEALIVNGD